MRLLPFTPEKDPTNQKEIVLRSRYFTVQAACEVLEGVYARTNPEQAKTAPVPEELDVSKLEMPADVDTITQYTEENTSQLSRAASSYAQVYDKNGLWRGGSS